MRPILIKSLTNKNQSPFYEVNAHVIIAGIRPEIWRDIQMSNNMTLDHLHCAIQGAFGWKNSHLHQFIISANEVYTGFGEDGQDDLIKIDSRKITVGSILERNLKRGIAYEYDFGDSWRHIIFFKGGIPLPQPLKMPKCISGERCGPPEDCGGPRGFQEFVEIMSNPRHKEYKSMKQWYGGTFDQDKFSLPTANKRIMEHLVYPQGW